MTTVDADPTLSLRRTLRPDDVSVAPAAAESAPTTPTEAPSTPSTPSPATPEQQRASREQSAGAEEARRAAMLRGPVGPAAPRPTVGLRAPQPAPTPPSTTPSTPSADTVARVDELERAGRTGAFAQSPEAARAHAAAVAAVLPQVDDPATRRALQRPLDDVAAAAARGAPAARAVVGELAPALSQRGVDALSGALQSAPAGPSGRAARDGLVEALRRTATENVDPLVRQQAAGGILNDSSTVARALSGTHPSLSRGALADLARDRPERVNQLLDVARDLDARGGAGGIEAALREGGLARTQLPEVGGVLGGVIDGVESLAAPFVRPVETAQNVAALGAALIADPAGTARAVGGSVVDAVRNDPARAVVGALVGSVGPGNVRRASAAGRVAGDAADAARVARVEGVAARAATGLGDLRPHEVEGIQRVVNEAQRRMDAVLESVGAQRGELPVDVVVVGSAARGARRNPDTDLPYGTGPGTRSDIDYAIPDPMVREHVFNSRNMSRPEEMFWRGLPGFDTRTVGGMLHHSTPSIDQPRVWFRAGRDPVFLPPGAPNPSLP
jgi:hypothetical protein